MNQHARPKRVRWTSDEDLLCAIFAGMGFSTKMIMERTGLSACQVSYRLHKGQIFRKDYRDGTSEMAARMISSIPDSSKTKRSIMGLSIIP